ncbi:MAG: tRNA pseudouridine(38-40) synthase TruA [Pyrinomonadaceae bacterium]
MNYRLTIQYDGTDFHGWQMQEPLRTVQGELTRALALLDDRDDVVVHGAGRTDAGVHAAGQVANVNLRREFAPERLRAAINGNIGRDVRVARAECVADEFHARFSAIGKTYVYRTYHHAFISPFWLRFAHHEARPLDLAGVRHAARLFLGTHDWTAFSSAHADTRSRVRTVTRLDINERASEDGTVGGRLIELTMGAEGFLRYMVRSIAGTLLAVGRGEMDVAQVAQAIEAASARSPAPQPRRKA